MILMILMAFSMAACSKDEEEADEVADVTDQATQEIPEDIVIPDDPTTKDYDNGIEFDEENEDFDVSVRKVSVDKFFGSWEATSGQALYQYGNVDIKVKANGRWTGNIADEDMSGKWVEKNGGIYLSSDLLEFQLAFTPDGTLVMLLQPDDDDDEHEDYIVTVLTKK